MRDNRIINTSLYPPKLQPNYSVSNEIPKARIGGRLKGLVREALATLVGQAAAELAQAAHFALHRVAVHFHHAAHFVVLLEDFVDFLNGGAAATSDAFAALAVDQVVVVALGGGHGIDDGFGDFQAGLVDSRVFWQFGEGADFREHAHELFKRAHFANLLQLVAEILEGEFVVLQFALKFARLLFVDGFLGFFDEREDVAHAEDARDDAIGMKLLDGVVFFADAREFYGRAGDFANGKRRTAARVAVELGENHSRDAETSVKFASGANRVLADHGVGDEKNFRRGKFALKRREFVHQFVVDMQAAGGVDENHVVCREFCFAHGAANDFERLVSTRAGPHRSMGGFGDLRELLARGGTIHVCRNDDGTMAICAEPLTELASGGGFAGALQAYNEPDRRRTRGELHADFFAEKFG